MKKILTFSIAVLAVLTLTVAPAFSGEGCTLSKAATDTKKASSAEAKASCAEKFGISQEECEKICKELGDDAQLTYISIKGMTCGGCESSVTKALEAVKGVKKVVKISHNDEMALVAVDKTMEDASVLTTAIANKGYQAEIIPAVAKTTTTDEKKPSCSSKEAGKACSSKCAVAEKKDSGSK